MKKIECGAWRYILHCGFYFAPYRVLSMRLNVRGRFWLGATEPRRRQATSEQHFVRYQHRVLRTKGRIRSNDP